VSALGYQAITHCAKRRRPGVLRTSRTIAASALRYSPISAACGSAPAGPVRLRQLAGVGGAAHDRGRPHPGGYRSCRVDGRLGMTVAEAVDRLPRRMASWAESRFLAPNSMTGISLALSLCAATWFSAGTRAGNVVGGLAVAGAYLAGRSARGLTGPAASSAVSASRLAMACAVISEAGVYAGLAAGGLAGGGKAAGRSGMWQLATVVLILVAVSQLAGACGSSPGAAGQRQASPAGMSWRRILAMPWGGRVLLIAVVVPVCDARDALLGLLGWAVIAIGWAAVTGRPGPAGSPGARAIVAARDDGPIASRLGRPIRGQLVPLPPALTGLAAVAVLVVLGLRSIPGFLLLAPVAAMLLAAAGASHPHDGRLDWMVPAVLQAGQYAYLAGLGFASGVPAPLVFALCAVIAVHYADLAGHAQRRTAMGWDGRMIAAGLGAALGIATFAYVLIAAYLGVLICREIATSLPAAMEGDGR
jgi:hypothetical protein